MHGFVSCVNLPTRVTENSSTCIEHIFLKTSLIGTSTSGILQTCITDHYPTYIGLGITSGTSKQATNPINHEWIKISKLNETNFKSSLADEVWEETLNCTDVDSAYNSFIVTFKRHIKDATVISIKKKLKTEENQTVDFSRYHHIYSQERCPAQKTNQIPQP
jgi:hypothetical protein